MFQLRIPDHTIVKQLGKGTYGDVFLAKTKGCNKMVAVKCIPRSTLSKRAQDNLVSEISILQKLRHQHVVMLYDFTWDSTNVYLIMDYCAGGDLSQFIREKRRLSENLVRYFLRQLALALQYLKLQNIVHMDLKPQNILLTKKTNPVLKVTDFGFASLQKDSVKRNELRGSLLYMAPEVYCDGFYHPSCDLWSVGVILYECLFGSPPYASTDSQSLRAKIIKDEPIQLPDSVPISESCALLLLGLLKRHPTERLDHEAFFNHPFVDLKHAPLIESLDQAVSLLTTAHQLTCQGQLEAAYEHYTKGLSYLLSTIQCETAAAKRTELLRLADEYFTQAEQVKARIREDNAKDPNTSSPSLKQSPPRRPPTLKQCGRTKGSAPVEPVVVRKAQLIAHKPPRPASYGTETGKEPTTVPEASLSSSPCSRPEPLTSSLGASQDGLLRRLWGYFSAKPSDDEMASGTPPVPEQAAAEPYHRSGKETGQLGQDDDDDDVVGSKESVNSAVCDKSPHGVSTQSVSHSTPARSREPPVRPPAPLQHSPKRHHRSSGETGGSDSVASSNHQSECDPLSAPSAETHKVASTGRRQVECDFVDRVDPNAAPLPPSSDATVILSGLDAPAPDASAVDCLTNPPRSLTRLRALSMEIKFPGRATMDDQQQLQHQTLRLATDHQPFAEMTSVGDMLSLFSDRSKLSEVKRMCLPDDSCSAALVHLEEFYTLLRSNRLSEALSCFELNFQRCLELAKADSNATRRRALLSELKLVLDLLERVKSQSPAGMLKKPDSPSSSSSGSCQPAEEAGIKGKKEAEDSCTTS